MPGSPFPLKLCRVVDGGGPGTRHEVPFQGLHDSPCLPWLLLWTGRGSAARKEEQPTIYISQDGDTQNDGAFTCPNKFYPKFEENISMSSGLQDLSTHLLGLLLLADHKKRKATYFLSLRIVIWKMREPPCVEILRTKLYTLKPSWLEYSP